MCFPRKYVKGTDTAGIEHFCSRSLNVRHDGRRGSSHSWAAEASRKQKDQVNQYVFLLLIDDREGVCQKTELSEKDRAREEVWLVGAQCPGNGSECAVNQVG